MCVCVCLCCGFVGAVVCVVCLPLHTAATNASDVLDPALTRPGRFDSKVTVDLPDRKGRKDIIELYLGKIIRGTGAWCAHTQYGILAAGAHCVRAFFLPPVVVRCEGLVP